MLPHSQLASKKRGDHLAPSQTPADEHVLFHSEGEHSIAISSTVASSQSLTYRFDCLAPHPAAVGGGGVPLAAFLRPDTIVDSLLAGRNVLVVNYGSPQTRRAEAVFDLQSPTDGMLFAILSPLYERLDASKSQNYKVTVESTFLEFFSEEVRDLLAVQPAADFSAIAKPAPAAAPTQEAVTKSSAFPHSPTRKRSNTAVTKPQRTDSSVEKQLSSSTSKAPLGFDDFGVVVEAHETTPDGTPLGTPVKKQPTAIFVPDLGAGTPPRTERSQSKTEIVMSHKPHAKRAASIAGATGPRIRFSNLTGAVVEGAQCLVFANIGEAFTMLSGGFAQRADMSVATNQWSQSVLSLTVRQSQVGGAEQLVGTLTLCEAVFVDRLRKSDAKPSAQTRKVLQSSAALRKLLLAVQDPRQRNNASVVNAVIRDSTFTQYVGPHCFGNSAHVILVAHAIVPSVPLQANGALALSADATDSSVDDEKVQDEFQLSAAVIRLVSPCCGVVLSADAVKINSIKVDVSTSALQSEIVSLRNRLLIAQEQDRLSGSSAPSSASQELNQQLVAHEAALTQLQESVERSRQRETELKRRFEARQRLVEATKRALRTHLEQQHSLELVVQELSAIQQASKRTGIDLAQRHQSLQRVNAELESAVADINRFRMLHDATEAKLMDSQARHRQEKQKYYARLFRGIVEMHSHAEETAKYQAEVANLNKSERVLTANLDTKARKVADMKEETERLRALAEELDRRADEIYNNPDVPRLEKEMRDVEAALAKARGEKMAAEGEIVTATREAEDIQGKIQQIKSESEERNGSVQAEGARLREEMNGVAFELAQAEAEYAEFDRLQRAEIERAQAQRQELIRLKSEKEEMGSKIEKVAGPFRELEEAALRLDKELADVELHLSKERAVLEAVTSSEQQMRRRNENLCHVVAARVVL